MQIRDRIVELVRVRAKELRPNPKNWRLHPAHQQEALRGLLAEIGYADALLARRLPDGALELIDGHLRAELTPDMEVPVLVLDLDDQESAKLLTLLDPLAGLAEPNEEVLQQLLAEVHTQNQALQAVLDS
ncbi:MAG TPA: ParB N-terminal domain-containing protein, partial [Thermoguttaceae bacterium]|nr:ParB N-terminal domain-containing protein [Thermoguttaceae bacterium]